MVKYPLPLQVGQRLADFIADVQDDVALPYRVGS